MSFIAYGPKVKIPVTEFAEIMGEECSPSGSPTLFELEEILDQFPRAESLNVRLLRKQIKWAAKISRKELGIEFRHPYEK